MRFLKAALFVLPVVGVFADSEAHPPHGHPPGPRPQGPKGDFKHKIPTPHESAVLARRMLRKASFATLSTVFPEADDELGNAWSRPKEVAGLPIALTHYYADCNPEGNPITLNFNIDTTFKNAAAGSNVSLSLDWASLMFQPSRGPSHGPSHGLSHGPSQGPPQGPPRGPHGESHHGPPPHGPPHSMPPAALPRFSIIGHLEIIESDEPDVNGGDVAKCYLDRHPDSARFLPGNSLHATRWAKIVVEQVFWVGGFGNVAYIGWISGDEWRSVTEEEMHRARLPGEVPPPHLSEHGPPHSHHRCSGPISGLRRVAHGLAGCVHHNEHVCPLPMRIVEAGVVAGWAFFVLALVFVPLSRWMERRRDARCLTLAANLRELADRARPVGPIEAADALEKKALLSDHEHIVG